MVSLQALVGIGDAEAAEGHAAAEGFAGLAEGERFAKGSEAGLEVGDGLGREVVAEIRREKCCGRSGLAGGRDRCRGPAFRLGVGGNPPQHGSGKTRDGGSGADGILIGEDRNRCAIVDEHLVVGDKAGDFAAVLDVAMAVAVAHVDAKAIVGSLPSLSFTAVNISL